MLPSIAVFCPDSFSSPRLKYVLKWVFEERFGLAFQTFSDKEAFLKSKALLINYSKEDIPEASIKIIPQGLLSQLHEIKEPAFAIQRWKHTTVLFYNQPGKKVPFDIFSALFYLISRYEEYLPFTPDKHGRYASENAVAGQYRFLSEPVIDQWLYHFKNLLIDEGLSIPSQSFKMQITYDVDMAWKYRHKSQKRKYGGFLKDMTSFKLSDLKERWQVLSGKKEDPFYSFPELIELHQKHDIHPLFFFLIGKEGEWDRNTPGEHPEMQKLIKELSKEYELGIHPSYGSYQKYEILTEEIELLSTTIQQKISKSRQHFIKFSLPDTYRNLIKVGIKQDYSMGYPDSNGFRAGTSHSFNWYDLKKEEETDLRISPFAFMDATSVYYLKQNPQETLKEWQRLYHKIQAVDGVFTSIWHNYILSRNSPWLSVFKEALEYGKRNIR